MSRWTHVVGAIHIDTYTKHKDIEEYVKKKLNKAPKLMFLLLLLSCSDSFGGEGTALSVSLACLWHKESSSRVSERLFPASF